VLEKSGFVVLNRWDGEAWINFGSFPLVGEVEIEVEAELAENKLKWKGKWKIGLEEVEVEIELEPKNMSEYGDLEWNMKLTDKPPINVFSMPIQSENLKFYYQPPLFQEYGFSQPFSNSTFFVNATHVMRLINGTWVNEAYRPENVVGSYAVYHATKTPFHRSEEEAEKYRAGKAFHIYRPKLIDVEGKTAWADLNIDEKKGVLTITLPRDFLDKAVYPVTIDPTFGYETAGGSQACIAHKFRSWTGTIERYYYRRGTAWSMSESGTTQSISAYVSGHDEIDITVAINEKDSEGTDSHGEIEKKENTGVSASAHWETFTLSGQTLNSGSNYILNIIGDAADLTTPPQAQGYNFYVHYDSNGVTSYYESVGSYSVENPWTVSPESEAKKYSIYCTYTAEAEDTTPPTYSNVGTNTTLAGQPCMFHCKWTDDTGLSGFIFSWNASGAWENDTWTSLSGAEAWANVTKTLPSSHVVVGYRWYCNDTSNNWNDTGIQFLQVVVCFQEIIQETINVSGMLMKQIKKFQTQTVALPDLSNKLTHILNVESLLSSDRIIKSLAILKSDSLSFLDGLFKRTSLFFYEKINIVEFLSKHFQTGKLESLNFADIFSKLIVKTSKETLNSADRPFKVLIKMEFESLNIVEALTKYIRLFRFENLNFADFPSKLIVKTPKESLVPTDRTIKVFTKVNSETLNLIDALTKRTLIFQFESLDSHDKISFNIFLLIRERVIEKLNIQDLPFKNLKVFKFESFQFQDLPFKLTRKIFAELIVFSDRQFTNVFIVVNEQVIQDFVNVGDRIIKKLTVVKADPLALPEIMTKSISIFKTDNISLLDRLFKRIGPFFYEKIMTEQVGFRDLAIAYAWTPWYNSPTEFMKVVLFGFCMVLLVIFIAKRL